ncbi:MAG TPA: UDP-N-acetylmuramoyl-L-alanyl-D-glutamate--2,6-diaminopimelate ligase [Steroidobacteraceae bacterium]|nr:UDP-N-acetylmuramoyl-L-alanyl-D-glutamate--2,6-diaminopimelate ligase [Steroidobacteraceae bacterium]
MSAASLVDHGVELAWLLAGLAAAPRILVRDLTLDSRSVQPGDAFVALAGRTTHGLDHAEEAVAHGAVAILWDPAEGRGLPSLPPAVTAVSVPGLRPELGDVADRFYRRPSTQAVLTAITGTNGKTTCAWLLAQCHGSGGAYLGTLGSGRPARLTPASHTTPDVVTLHRTLRALVDDGAQHVALEASSHALDQERLAGAQLPITGFTNLTRDHLDYHGTMAAYGAAKERLFHRRGVRHAVINVGDRFGRELAARLPAGVTLTTVRADGVVPAGGRHVVAQRVDCDTRGLAVTGTTHAGRFELRSPLIGAFNADNELLVLGLLLAADMPLPQATAALSTAVAPPGRMEAFTRGSEGPTLVVDYAHSPDALTKALAALRAHTTGRLWCVFGCGGDRDPGKRPLMAAAVEAAADRIVITDDNPRSEDPERIVAMLSGALTGRVPVHIEHDRAKAIAAATAEARPGDVVLIAGKGHEDYQLYGTERRHYSDREVARALAAGTA